MSRKTKVTLVVLALLALMALAIPIKMECGHALYGCTTAPDPSGIYYTYYEVEPLGITLLETLIGVNLRVYYSSARDWHSIDD